MFDTVCNFCTWGLKLLKVRNGRTNRKARSKTKKLGRLSLGPNRCAKRKYCSAYLQADATRLWRFSSWIRGFFQRRAHTYNMKNKWCGPLPKNVSSSTQQATLAHQLGNLGLAETRAPTRDPRGGLPECWCLAPNSTGRAGWPGAGPETAHTGAKADVSVW